MSVQFSRSVVSTSLQPHGLEHARPPCPSPTPRAYSISCPLSRWCHTTVSSSVIPFSSCLQSFPASGSFLSQFFASGGQSIGASASTSVLLRNIQDWFPLGWTGWSSLQSKGLSRVFFKAMCVLLNPCVPLLSHLGGKLASDPELLAACSVLKSTMGKSWHLSIYGLERSAGVSRLKATVIHTVCRWPVYLGSRWFGSRGIKMRQ